MIRLWSRDPENWLGSNGAEENEERPFFKSSMSAFLSPRFNGPTASFTLSVDWKKLLAK
jgi:hypothetical protein